MLNHPALRLTLIMLLALGVAVFAACSGGGDGNGSDEEKIRALVDDTFAAFNDLDGEKLAGLVSQECEVSAEEMSQTLALLDALSGEEDLLVTVDNVEISNLEAMSADVHIVGTIAFGDEERPLGEEGQTSPVVKEGDNWRWADCSEWDTQSTGSS